MKLVLLRMNRAQCRSHQCRRRLCQRTQLHLEFLVFVVRSLGLLPLSPYKPRKCSCAQPLPVSCLRVLFACRVQLRQRQATCSPKMMFTGGDGAIYLADEIFAQVSTKGQYSMRWSAAEFSRQIFARKNQGPLTAYGQDSRKYNSRVHAYVLFPPLLHADCSLAFHLWARRLRQVVLQSSFLASSGPSSLARSQTSKPWRLA